MQTVSRDRLGVEPEIVDSGHLPALSVPAALAALLTRHTQGLDMP